MHDAGTIGVEGRTGWTRDLRVASLSGTSSISVSRMLWTRALPCSVAMLAALSVPELSLGAGDLNKSQFVIVPEIPSVSATMQPVPVAAPLAELQREKWPREPLAVVGSVPVSAGIESGVDLVSVVMPVSDEPRPTASRAAPALTAKAALPSASAPLLAETAAIALEAPSAPVSGAEALVPAGVSGQPVGDAAAAVTAMPQATPAVQPSGLVNRDESAALAFGGVKGAFVALVEPVASALAAVPESALAAEAAAVAVPATRTAPRDAAPGARAPQRDAALVALPDPANRAAALADAAPSKPSPEPRALATPAKPAPPVPAARTVALAPAAAIQPARAPVPAAAAVAPRARPGAAPARIALEQPASATVRPNSAVTAPAQVVAPPRRAAPPAAAAASPVPPVAAAVPPRPARSAASATLSAIDKFDVKTQLITRVDGKSAGAVDFQQTTAGLKVRLGSIVELLGDRFDPAQIDRIRASSASNAYLSLAELQAQGIPISYDPVYDEFNVGTTDTRPKAARKVHMDQISAPERGGASSRIDQLRRR